MYCLLTSVGLLARLTWRHLCSVRSIWCTVIGWMVVYGLYWLIMRIFMFLLSQVNTLTTLVLSRWLNILFKVNYSKLLTLAWFILLYIIILPGIFVKKYKIQVTMNDQQLSSCGLQSVMFEANVNLSIHYCQQQAWHSPFVSKRATPVVWHHQVN